MLSISEKFASIQGEGQYVGTCMFFIRLAGCSVGKGDFPFTCTTWNGQEFQCDTDYRKKEESSISDLIDEVRASKLQHVCITGGEPLMHKDTPKLLRSLAFEGITFHVETSGTVDVATPALWPRRLFHLTVSPKTGYLPSVLDEAHEIKILVGDDDVTARGILREFGKWADKIWVQPINGFLMLDQENVERCLEIIAEEPRFRLSIQLHKVIGVR